MEAKKLLYVNQDLELETDPDKIVAVVGFFSETTFKGQRDLGDICDDKLINIAFLKSIGRYRSFRGSLDLQREWQEKNYPEHYSTLISDMFCRLAIDFKLNTFDDCWTRSVDNDGYPCYRGFPVYRKSKIPCLGYNKNIQRKNVFVSLVLTQEDFRALNPEVQLADYYLME